VEASQVYALLDLLAVEGITGWLDGGWGVDALLGEQTREHSDADLVVDAGAVGRLAEALARQGFVVLRDQLPVAIVFRHPDGREVDVHPIELTPDGGGDQRHRTWAVASLNSMRIAA
jgi:lincosamide nucleotidyltransferase A/C/D/E